MEAMLSSMIIFGLLLGLAIFGAWIWALVDILRSTFSDIAIKIIWFLLVFCIPLLGFILYVILGKSTKIVEVTQISSPKYDDLEKIKKLHDSGVLNDDEYESEKSKLLNS
jgi:hypothetical protein